MSELHDVIIIGAGPSGSIAAANMVKRGFKPLILERALFPRFSIGESLLPHCMQFIEEAGLVEAVHANADEKGFQFKNGAVFNYGDLHSTFDFTEKFSPGPGTTYQVRRANFDKLLADEAEKAGTEIRYHQEIIHADFSGEQPELTVRDHANGGEYTIRARFMLDASGFGRVLPRLLGLEAPSNFPVRQAIFTHVEDRITSENFDRNKILVTVHPHNRHVWYWTIPFGDGRASLGVVAEQAYFDTIPGTPEGKLRQIVSEAPCLARHLRDAIYDTPCQVITGYSANVKSLIGPGYALLGNAGEFLDPVFSSGVTVAMKSASLAAAVLDRQLRGEAVDWEQEFCIPLKQGVSTFRTYVETWYDASFQDVIFYDKKSPEIKAMISSILAGYAWDQNNPFVAHSRRRLEALVHACRIG
jgi:flavin-dependent dehydrogenase